MLKAQSGSSPVRIVFNRGISLKEWLAKGPKHFKQLGEIYLDLSRNVYALSVKCVLQKSLNWICILRFLLRDMNTSKPVVHYILKPITDKPGGPIAITVMKRIADVGS